jgi:hypothetical protein
MASERFEGIVNELERSGAGQEVLMTFWLVADDGTRALVEARRDRPLRNGDRVEVFGERDSQGTLAATSIQNPKKAPDSRVQPLQWGRIVLSSVLSALISAAVAFSLPYLFSTPKSVGQAFSDIFAAVIFIPILYFGLSLVCSMVLTSIMVSYRRLAHALIAAPISMPIFFIFLWLLVKVSH